MKIKLHMCNTNVAYSPHHSTISADLFYIEQMRDIWQHYWNVYTCILINGMILLEIENVKSTSL